MRKRREATGDTARRPQHACSLAGLQPYEKHGHLQQAYRPKPCTPAVLLPRSPRRRPISTKPLSPRLAADSRPYRIVGSGAGRSGVRGLCWMRKVHGTRCSWSSTRSSRQAWCIQADARHCSTCCNEGSDTRAQQALSSEHRRPISLPPHLYLVHQQYAGGR